MKDLSILQSLIGQSLVEEDLKFVDSFYTKHFGLFIPIGGPCGYAKKTNHKHPAYSVAILFDHDVNRKNHFYAEIYPPNVKHCDFENLHYYAVFIEKDYFENRFKMYQDKLPKKIQSFELCIDILKFLNMFAFEYSKNMVNSDITLDAQTELMTHWIIRSLLGESMDMRAISNDYSVARAQHYMEQHFSEPITVEQLASLGYVSASSLTHKFKNEMGVSPIEYLIELRINRAKILLQRKTFSITEIAMQCGFSSLAHFSNCFQKRENITPSEYQKKFC